MVSFCKMESWPIREDRFWILTSRKERDLGVWLSARTQRSRLGGTKYLIRNTEANWVNREIPWRLMWKGPHHEFVKKLLTHQHCVHRYRNQNWVVNPEWKRQNPGSGWERNHTDSKKGAGGVNVRDKTYSKNWDTEKNKNHTSLGISLTLESGQLERWYFHLGASNGISVWGGGGGSPHDNQRYICHREAFFPRQRDFDTPGTAYHQREGWQGRKWGTVRARENLRVGDWKSEIEVSRWVECI